MFCGYSVKRVHIFEICAYFVKMCLFVYFEIEVIFSHTGSTCIHTRATLQANWGTVSSRSILKRFAFVWWTRLRHSSLGTGFRCYPQPRICTNIHISSKYAQNMHILENMHISRKVASARPPCSQMEREKKNVNQWASNFCFEKHNYLLGLQPAPTTASRELQKNLYVLCILCAYFVHIHWRICTFVHILART